MRNKLGAFGLAAVFALLAAAIGLRLKGIAMVGDANLLDKTFQTSMDNRFLPYLGNEGQFRTSASRFAASLAPGKNLSYNIIVLNPNGDVLYKLDDHFMTGNRAVAIMTGSEAILFGTQSGKAVKLLLTNYADQTRTIGSAADIAANRQKIDAAGSQQVSDGAGLLNAEIYTTTDDTQTVQYYTFWIYDSNTSAYMTSTHTDGMRRTAKTLGMLVIPALAAYWLLLALWVWMDARRLGHWPWRWAALVLVTNAAGFLVYWVARSQGFCMHSAVGCAACGKPMLRGWARCPHCGSTEEVQP